ncbi:hypothetical protein [Mucilaginibacter sp. UYCu711]|uniref:hypothetical protein n=1 Tax=Mucilaginibacter sp. UYCu711 TaxID=3156339 RepID=UPI003D2608B8
MSKLLVSQDDRLLNAIMSDIKYFVPLFERVKTTYSAVGSGNISDADFALIKAGNAEPIVQRYHANVIDNLLATSLISDISEYVETGLIVGPMTDFTLPFGILPMPKPSHNMKSVIHLVMVN